MSPDMNDSYAPEPIERDLWAREGLRLPEAPSAFYNRDLFESYQRRCFSGAAKSDEVICSPRGFSIDDHFIFNKLYKLVLEDVEYTLGHQTPTDRQVHVEPRFLHHRVVRSNHADEHHVLVEFRDHDLHSVVATRGCLEIFKTGPVAFHYHVIDGEALIIHEMASSAAWTETVKAFNCFSHVQAEGARAKNWAFALMADLFSAKPRGALHFDVSWADEVARAEEAVRAIQSIEPIQNGGFNVFRVRAGDSFYHVRLELDVYGSRPIVWKIGPCEW